MHLPVFVRDVVLVDVQLVRAASNIPILERQSVSDWKFYLRLEVQGRAGCDC